MSPWVRGSHRGRLDLDHRHELSRNESHRAGGRCVVEVGSRRFTNGGVVTVVVPALGPSSERRKRVTDAGAGGERRDAGGTHPAVVIGCHQGEVGHFGAGEHVDNGVVQRPGGRNGGRAGRGGGPLQPNRRCLGRRLADLSGRPAAVTPRGRSPTDHGGAEIVVGRPVGGPLEGNGPPRRLAPDSPGTAQGSAAKAVNGSPPAMSRRARSARRRAPVSGRISPPTENVTGPRMVNHGAEA